MTPPLARHNICLLDQAVAVIRDLDDAAYMYATKGPLDSGVGSHFRHVFDHYQLFLAGCECRRIDYDRRQRDARIERDREYAASGLERVRARLGLIDASQADVVLEVRMDCGGDRPDDHWCRSTVKRELQCLAMHDVHHFALIAFMLRAQGRETPPGFGIAPSTLKHLQSSDSCAR